MSLGSKRQYSLWLDASINNMKNINGAFIIQLANTIMIPQSIEFLKELATRCIDQSSRSNINPDILSILDSFNMYIPSDRLDTIAYPRSFSTGNDLINYDISDIFEILSKLELILDIKLHPQEISYCIRTFGHLESIATYKKLSMLRGLSFEICERGIAMQTLLNSAQINVTEKVELAQHLYSAGLLLLNLEDSIPSDKEAAFTQFYLVLESILGWNSIKQKLKQQPYCKHAQLVNACLHVETARNNFFNHSDIKKNALINIKNDAELSATIAKQVLVAKWAARELIAIESGLTLVNREMRLYLSRDKSICFNGDEKLLLTEFKLP